MTSSTRPTSTPGKDFGAHSSGSAKATSPLDQASGDPALSKRSVTVEAFQQLIRAMYLEKDVERGIDGTFMWLIEEVGELAAALRSGTPPEQAAEFADVLAWLATIANVAGIDLSDAIQSKYGSGCPGCGGLVCTCDNAEKP